jgi:hypothetical protein
MAREARDAACYMAGVLEALYDQGDIDDAIVSDVNVLLEEADLENVKIGTIGPSTNFVDHSFEEGDHATDQHEPTQSPEKNIVHITEVTGQRANEYETGDGCLVSDYKTNSAYPEDDPVVIGEYANMSGDYEWAFPESRLHPI